MSRIVHAKDFDYINRIFLLAEEKISSGHGATLRPVERHAVALWAASGIVGNGGFQYFFENGLSAEDTAAGYDFIGMPRIGEIMRTALSLLPKGQPSQDWPATLRAIEAKEVLFDQLAMELVRADAEMITRLANHLRAAGIS